jgi:hypothetical protein
MKFTLSWLKDHLDTTATAAEIAEALARLADSPTLRRHLGENARRVARERFTSDAYLARLRRYYDELVTTRGLRGDPSGPPEPPPACRP